MFTAWGPLYETDLLFGGELGELRQAVGQPNKPKEVNSKPYTLIRTSHLARTHTEPPTLKR